MVNELKYLTFETRLGWVGVLAGRKGLMGTTLPCPTDEEALRLLGDRVKEATWSPDFFGELRRCFAAYFEGAPVSFPDVLDLSSGTSFQQAVWRMTRLIPYGETRSYKWVSEAVGKAQAMRAVGQALGKNPLPIVIPCHRVIATGGGLCGFGGGLELKRVLLRLENPRIFN